MAIITTEQALDEAARFYSAQPEFVFDVETIGEDRATARTAQVAWLSLSAGGRSDTIPMGHPHGALLRSEPVVLASGLRKQAQGRPLSKSDYSKVSTTPVWGPRPDQLDRVTVFEALEPLFFSDALKVGHNVKFDLHAVAKYYEGQYPTGPYYDTMVATWLLDVTRRGFALDDCYRREVGGTLVKGVGKNIAEHSFEEVAKYSERDSEATWELKQALDKRYAVERRLRSLLDLEMEVMYPVLEMEANGVLIDRARMEEIGASLMESIETLTVRAYLLAGGRFNIRSNKDKQGLLYKSRRDGGFGFRGIKTTPSASDKPAREMDTYDYSVDAESLERMQHGNSDGNEFVRVLLAHAAKSKMHGTYVMPYLGGERETSGGKIVKVASRLSHDNRIHAQFKQSGAESGRFSSSEPNLQNIPARSEEGKRLRGVFVPDPGFTMICADYSQIEPRIIASLSQDKTMIATYRDGGDVYQAVADRMGVTRGAGKELVLSISYGIGADRISSRIGCTPAEAADLMEYFKEKFPRIPEHRQAVITKAKSDKYSETVLGRRRNLPALGWANRGLRAEAERQAYNHVIQGSAADVMKIALVNIHAALPEGAMMLMTVHDEVVVQAPDEMVEETVAVIRCEMEQARPRTIVVPLVVDIGTGRSWLECK